MKKLLLPFLCILAVNAFAAPYWGEIQKFKQPDGTWVDVKLYGDEYYIRGEGLDGGSHCRVPGPGKAREALLILEQEELPDPLSTW